MHILVKILLVMELDILILIGKTIVFYFFLIIVIRIMGKREVGNLSIFDLAVYFTISDLITMSIVDKKNPIYLPAISVAILVLLQVFLSHVSLRNKKIRDLLDGKKSIIINNGDIDFAEMEKQRYSLDDLFTQLRDKGFDSISNVKWAILETSGRLSVISYDESKSDYPDPIISDGVIDYQNLAQCKKTEQWLYNEICKSKISNIKKIKLAILIDDHLCFFL